MLERLKSLINVIGKDRARQIFHEIASSRQLNQSYVHVETSMPNEELLFRYALADAITNLGACTVKKSIFTIQYNIIKVITSTERYDPSKIAGYVLLSSNGDCFLIESKYIAAFMRTCNLTELDMLKLEDNKLIIRDIPSNIEVECMYEFVYHEDGYTPFMVRRPNAPENSRNPKDYVHKRRVKVDYLTLKDRCKSK